MALLFAVVTLTACAGLHRLGLPAINAVLAFTIPWSVVLLIADFPGVLGDPLTGGTWAMVWVAWLALTVGVVAGWFSVLRVAPPFGPMNARVVDPTRLLRLHVVCSIALVGYLLLQSGWIVPVLSAQGGLDAILNGGGSALKRAYMLATAEVAQTNFGPLGLAAAALGYLLFFGNVSLFTGVLLWRAGRYVLAVIPLVLAAFYSLVTLQRTSFVMATLVMVACWAVIRSLPFDFGSLARVGPAPSRRRSIAALAGVGAIGVVTVLYPLIVRNTNTANPVGLESVANYLLSGVSGLNARLLENPQWSPPEIAGTDVVAASPGFGAYTFTGLFNILSRLGLPVPYAPHSLDYYDVVIFGRPTTTNVGTFLVEFYLDFGWLGIVLIPLAVGLIAGLAQKKVTRSASLLFLPPLAWALVVLIWSFFTSSLLGDFRYIALCGLGGIVLNWIMGTRVPRRWGLRGRADSEALARVQAEGNR